MSQHIGACRRTIDCHSVLVCTGKISMRYWLQPKQHTRDKRQFSELSERNTTTMNNLMSNNNKNIDTSIGSIWRPLSPCATLIVKHLNLVCQEQRNTSTRYTPYFL